MDYLDTKDGRRGVHAETLTSGVDNGGLGKRQDERQPYEASTCDIGP
jgi:hypothetical protein